MTPTEQHPDPGFIARLEDRLTDDYRRLERIGSLDGRQPVLGRRLRSAAIALAGLLLGAACVTVAQRIEDSERLELLERQARTSVELAARRVEFERRALEDLETRWETGVAVIASSTVAYEARATLIEAEAGLALAELALEEIEAGAGPVGNEISAPRRGGRDFFSERLQIELEGNAERRAAVAQMIDFVEARVNAGVDAPRSLLPLTAERGRLEAEAERIRETLALRESFLDGDIDAAEAELGHRLLLARTRQSIAESSLADLRAENERLEGRLAAGVGTVDEVVASRRDLLAAEGDAEIARLEVELIELELDLEQISARR